MLGGYNSQLKYQNDLFVWKWLPNPAAILWGFGLLNFPTVSYDRLTECGRALFGSWADRPSVGPTWAELARSDGWWPMGIDRRALIARPAEARATPRHDSFHVDWCNISWQDGNNLSPHLQDIRSVETIERPYISHIIVLFSLLLNLSVTSS